MDEEKDMLQYILGQLEDGYIDISGNHGDKYDRNTISLLERVVREYYERTFGVEQ